MPFSITQYETAVSRVANGTSDLRDLIPGISVAASIAMNHQWYLPEFVKNAIRWFADQLTTLLKGIADTVGDLLKGAIAPALFFMHGHTWQRDVRGPASVVSGALKSSPLLMEDAWSGSAYDAYIKVIPRQSDAADRIARIASRTAQALNTCAAAGLVFYVALGFILYKLIAAAVAAIGAFGSAVFSWAGAAIIYEEAAIDMGLMILLMTTLAALVGVQVTEISALQGESVDVTTFPRGRWPDPVRHKYTDATVRDGDADWSLRPQ